MDKADMVRHPPHYKGHPSGLECIELTEYMGFCLGNAIKYIWRSGLKAPSELEDWKKARWYVQRHITQPKGDSQVTPLTMAIVDRYRQHEPDPQKALVISYLVESELGSGLLQRALELIDRRIAALEVEIDE